jgi:HSP20 family molecular chaperone IbpA
MSSLLFSSLIFFSAVPSPSFGSFCRSFQIPPEATKDDVSAKFVDGVLEVAVKKRPAPPTEDRRIPIE